MDRLRMDLSRAAEPLHEHLLTAFTCAAAAVRCPPLILVIQRFRHRRRRDRRLVDARAHLPLNCRRFVALLMCIADALDDDRPRFPCVLGVVVFGLFAHLRRDIAEVWMHMLDAICDISCISVHGLVRGGGVAPAVHQSKKCNRCRCFHSVDFPSTPKALDCPHSERAGAGACVRAHVGAAYAFKVSAAYAHGDDTYDTCLLAEAPLLAQRGGARAVLSGGGR